MIVDVLLTPDNAEVYGYKWVDDLLPAILKGEVRSIKDFDDKQYWRIGKAKIVNCILGLYKPVRKRE